MISCSYVFEDAYKLGVNASCEYSSGPELIITLDKIASGATLTLKSNSIKDSLWILY
jgi:hypothetical protein